MFRSARRRDSADQDDMSLDFGLAFPPQLQLLPTGQTEDSGSLWAPGKETDGAGTTLALKVRTPTEKAADELNRIYANLPTTAYDLTFQDLVEYGHSPKSATEKVDKARKGESAEKIRAHKKNESRKVKVVKETGSGKSPTKQHGTTTGVWKKKETVKGNGNDSPSLSVKSKLTGVLYSAIKSPTISYAPSKSRLPTPDRVDKLLEKRGKQSPKREGLYSASTTPTASFRRVLPDSPTLSGRSSARTSFSDYMLPIDNVSFEKELSKSFGFTADNNNLGAPPSSSLSPQHRLLETRSRNSRTLSRSRNSKSAMPVAEKSECATCSLKNLIFETRCTKCKTSYCYRCAEFTTKPTPEGRRCLDDCERPTGIDYKTKKKATMVSCWSFLMCHRPNSASQ